MVDLWIPIGIAGAILVLIPFITIFLCIALSSFNRTRPHPINANSNTRTSNKPFSPKSDIESNGCTSATFDPSVREVSMSELITATNNFDSARIIGDGGFGLVYRAILPSTGITVAVKKLSLDAFQGLREFRAEMETLASIRHPNIVRILGFCVSGPDRILIYEFVERGSLDDWLHETTPLPVTEITADFEACPKEPLSWRTRLRIVKGVAMGLAHMHGLDRPIVHRDIKAGNVLLDMGFEAHIADFGLARRIAGADSHLSTQAAGTMGYMPPEYRQGYTKATVKADVYSFGVLVFEVVTGRRPSWPVREEGGGREVSLVEWVKRKIGERKETEIVDGRVKEELRREEEEEVREVLRVADVCTKEKAGERPRSNEVVEMLNRIGVGIEI